MRKLPRLSKTRVVLILAAAVVGYFIFSATGDAILSRQLNRDEDRLASEIDDLSGEQQQLEAIRDYLRSDEYVEAIARRTLGFVRPGETLYTVSSSVPPTPTPAGDDGADGGLRWWEKLYSTD